MWLTYIAVPLVIAAIVASVVGGGIFTIILVPLAVICVVAAVAAAAFARATGTETAVRRSATEAGPGGSALPRRRSTPSGRAPTSPGALADAPRERR
jgi:hypothetical protein